MGGTPMPLFGRVSPRGSRAASWSIPHVLGLPQHDFRCSFRWCGSRVQDSRPGHRTRAGSLSRLLKPRPIWAVWDHRWECVGGRPSR
eukprot:scaffold7_cov414-Pavlova_lutheri.AAC.30